MLFVIEPFALRGSPVYYVKVYVPYPVDVGGRGELGVDAPYAEVFGVKLHFSVKGGGGHKALWVEPQDIGLSALHLKAVYKEVIVEHVGGGRRRIGELKVENAYSGLVEIGLEKVGARKLPHGVVVFKA